MPLDALTREYFETLHEVYVERGLLAAASYDLGTSIFLCGNRLEQFGERAALTEMMNALPERLVDYDWHLHILEDLEEGRRNFLLRHRRPMLC